MSACFDVIRGTDVIGLPGQNLSERELTILVSLADGIPPQKIAEHLKADLYTVRDVEAVLQAKLGAKNKAHMITRGFTLGVLLPNALCMLLTLASALDLDSFNRQRIQRRHRNGGEIARIIRLSPSSRGAQGDNLNA